jgi:putative ABC transport system substrate-binding protein
MNRRQTVGLLVGAAAWPLVARAQQQSERMRRIAVLMPAAVDDTHYQTWFRAFLEGLQQSGWIMGQNVQVDARWATANPDAVRRNAAELAAIAPDVILATGASTLRPLLKVTRGVPIVFASVADPVGGGFVDSLARPGGNAPGFMSLEYSISAKWLELLKHMAPSVTRVAVIRDSTRTSGTGQFGIIQAMARALGVEISHVNEHDATEIERGVTSFARSSNGGLITAVSGLALIHRHLIIKLAAQYRLPAIYFERAFAAAGGLMSYGPDQADQFRRAADYVDRILKGEKPAELPVQAPTKYELVINVKTAKALGLEVPPTLLARADEVIE